MLQHLQQLFGIILDRHDREAVEQLRKGSFHDLPVLEDIRNTGRASQVVFQDVNRAIGVTDEVGSGNVAPDSPRRIQADALLEKVFAGMDHILGKNPIAYDVLVVINIVNKEVQRPNSLLETGINESPFAALDDARDQVKRPDFFGPGFMTIDIERDSHVQQRLVRHTLALGEFTLT